MTTPCPVCGSVDAPKFDVKSDWCVDCTSGTLAEQEQLRHAVQHPEIVVRVTTL